MIMKSQYASQCRVGLSIFMAGLVAILMILATMPIAESTYVGCEQPIVKTNEAEITSCTTVTLNGSLLDKGEAHTVFVSFVWGIGDESCTISECEDRDCDSGDCPACGDKTPEQAMTSTGTFSFDLTNLQPDTTYFFRASANGCANTDCDHSLTFTTPSCAPCTSPTVTTDAPIVGTTPDAMTLNGTLEDLGTLTTVDVFFEWGTDTSYGNQTSAQAMTSTGTFSSELTELELDIDYHFRAIAIGCNDEYIYGEDREFRPGECTSPTVKTDAPNAGTALDTMTLNGTLENLGTLATVDVFFEWGTSTSYGNQTPSQAMTSTGTFSSELSGLEPDIDYHFRAVAIGCDDEYIYGEDREFRAGECTSPEVETSGSTGISITVATIIGELINLGTFENVDVSFEWGFDTSYGNETDSQTMSGTGTFSSQLTSLIPGTEYHFRAKTSGCVDYVYGNDMVFTTLFNEPQCTDDLDCPPGLICVNGICRPVIDIPNPPEVTTENATDVSKDTAIINGILENLGDSATVQVYFEWGTNDSYGFVTQPQAMTGTGTFFATLSGNLQCNTTYHFRAVGIGNGSDYGEDMAFTTSSCVIPSNAPEVETSDYYDVSMDSATITGILEDMGMYSSVEVLFVWGKESHDDLHADQYDNQTSTQYMNQTGTYSQHLDNLESDTTYYYRAKAIGGNYGDEYMFTTQCIGVITVTTESDSITTSSAALSGILEDMGAETAVNVYFEWGTTSDYGNQTASQPRNSTGQFMTDIDDLECDTDYHFRAVAVGETCTDVGIDKFFRTPKCDDGGLNPWFYIGPILAALLFALFFYLFFMRKKESEEEATA